MSDSCLSPWVPGLVADLPHRGLEGPRVRPPPTSLPRSLGGAALRWRLGAGTLLGSGPWAPQGSGRHVEAEGSPRDSTERGASRCPGPGHAGPAALAAPGDLAESGWVLGPGKGPRPLTPNLRVALGWRVEGGSPLRPRCRGVCLDEAVGAQWAACGVAVSRDPPPRPRSGWGVSGVSEAEPNVAGAVSALQQAPRSGPRGRAAGLHQGWGWALGAGLRAPSGGRRLGAAVPCVFRGGCGSLEAGLRCPRCPEAGQELDPPRGARPGSHAALSGPREGLMNSEVLPASSGVSEGKWAGLVSCYHRAQ